MFIIGQVVKLITVIRIYFFYLDDLLKNVIVLYYSMIPTDIYNMYI